MVAYLCFLPLLTKQIKITFFHPKKRGGTIKGMIQKLKGQAPFEVDESFLLNEIGKDLSEEERELMAMFIDQSQESQAETREELEIVEEEEEMKLNASSGAYYRICDVPEKLCDESPLENIECPERITSRKKTVFGHEGMMIHTDGTGKATKLTKVYKRQDNRGWLMGALKRIDRKSVV